MQDFVHQQYNAGMHVQHSFSTNLSWPSLFFLWMQSQMHVYHAIIILQHVMRICFLHTHMTYIYIQSTSLKHTIETAYRTIYFINKKNHRLSTQSWRKKTQKKTTLRNSWDIILCLHIDVWKHNYISPGLTSPPRFTLQKRLFTSYAPSFKGSTKLPAMSMTARASASSKVGRLEFAHGLGDFVALKHIGFPTES